MPDSKRFTLGAHSAKGWHILDGERKRMFYYSGTEEEARKYVGHRNLLEDVFDTQKHNADAAEDMFLAWLEGND